MYFIDSHAHLTEKAFDKDIKNIITNLQKNNISKVVTIGCTIREAKLAIQLAKQNKNIYPVAGLYPSDTEDNAIEIGTTRNNPNYIDLLLNELKNLIQNNNNGIVGIGECGLDYTTPPPWEIQRTKKEQKKLFESQIQLAKIFKLPIVIHSRKAKEDTLSIIQNNYKEINTINGVWHCYSEDLKTAKAVIKRGFYISISGLITYNNMDNLIEVVKTIPLEKLLIETDSPFLVPQAKRKEGIKRNEPQYVKIVAEKIAEIKGIPLETVAFQTSKNAENLFKI